MKKTLTFNNMTVQKHNDRENKRKSTCIIINLIENTFYALK